MTTLRELKQKYSGQQIPEWELAALEVKTSTPSQEPDKPKNKGGRPRKTEIETATDPVIDGDSDAN